MPFGHERCICASVEGTGEQKALAAVALLALEVFELVVVFDTLGERLPPEGSAKFDQSVEQGY